MGAHKAVQLVRAGFTSAAQAGFAAALGRLWQGARWSAAACEHSWHRIRDPVAAGTQSRASTGCALGLLAAATAIVFSQINN